MCRVQDLQRSAWPDHLRHEHGRQAPEGTDKDWQVHGAGLTRVCSRKFISSFSHELTGPYSHWRLLKGVLPVLCGKCCYSCYLLGDACCHCICPC